MNHGICNGSNLNSLLIAFYFRRLLPVYLLFQNLLILSFQYRMNMIFKKKQNIKLKQKIGFAHSATNFLAYRRNIFIIQIPLFAQVFLFNFRKFDADAVILIIIFFLDTDAVNLFR